MFKTMAGLVAVALLVGTACGDDDGEDGSSPDEEAAAEVEQWDLPGEFCADYRVSREQYDQAREVDPEEGATAEAAFAQFADAMRRVTPADAIADDWAIFASIYEQDRADVSDERFRQAVQNVNAYLTEECGLSFDVVE